MEALPTRSPLLIKQFVRVGLFVIKVSLIVMLTMQMIKQMLVLIKSAGALKAQLAPLPPYSHQHLSRTLPVHTKGLEHLTLSLQMVHSPLMHEMKNFHVLRVILILFQTVI